MSEEIKNEEVVEEVKAAEEAAEEKEEAVEETSAEPAEDEDVPMEPVFTPNDLIYQFYDPEDQLPEEYHQEIPEKITTVAIRYNELFNIMGDKFNSIITVGNSYVYAALDKATQAPSMQFKKIKEFINYMVENNKAIIIFVVDPVIKPTQYLLAKKLIEDTLVKFRVAYTDIAINPAINYDMFSVNNPDQSSLALTVPVHDNHGNTAMFTAFSVGVKGEATKPQETN